MHGGRSKQKRDVLDAPRTPTSLRSIRKDARPTRTSLSPSLNKVKVNSIRKLFEQKVTDRDAPLTTSPLLTRYNFNPELNPLKCVDQWNETSQQRPRRDWTTAGYLDGEMHQSREILQIQDRDSELGSH